MKPTLAFFHRSKLLTSGLLVAAALWAQPLQALSPPERNITPKPMLLPPPPQLPLEPELLIRSAGARQPIQAQTLTIDTHIVGRLAQTRVELVLFNPNEQVLEAELQFPLQNGQEVTAFALDINGKLRDAVAVEKAKAQQVFEDITRVRVDPALLERTVGNNYKLRVYPMPARGVRRVALTITEVLKPQGSQANALAQYSFALTPFNSSTQVQWRVTVQDSAANSVKPGAGLAAFSSNGRDAQLSVQGARGTLPESLGLALPYARGAVQTTQTFDGEEFVYIEVPAPAFKAVAARAPKTIGLVWDASGSMQRADRARIFALLDSYFAKLGSVEVKLQVARNMAEKQVSFTVRGGDWSALKTALQTLDYDGGTAAAALSFNGSADLVLIATDGISNFGNAQFKRPTSRSFALLASASSNAAAMRGWTQASGGDALDLLQLSPAQALERLSTDSVRLANINGKGVARITSGGALPEAGVFTVAGVLNARFGEPTSVDLEFLHNGNLTRQTVNIVRSNTRSGDGSADRTAIAAQRWASLRIAELAASGVDDSAEQITALGKRFAVVSDTTSLIVLDNLSDYVRHAISPPAELRAQYDAQLQRQQGQVARQKTDNIARVAQAWAARTQWWQREFPKEAPVAAKKEVPAPAIGGGASGAVQRQMAREPNQLRETAQDQAAQSEASRARSDRRVVLDDPAPIAAPPVASAAPRPPPAPAVSPASPVQQSAMATKPIALERSALPNAASNQEAKAVAPAQTTIRLQTMQASSSALRELRDMAKTSSAERYAYYLKLRADNAESSAFYLEAAQVFFDKGEAALGLRVLSNLAEMNLENRHLLRVLGTRLIQAKLPELALPVLANVLRLAPNEPQSQRDLGLAHAQAGNPQAAVEALYKVVVGKWDSRFADVDMTALAELNAIVATSSKALDVRFIDPRLLGNLPLDLRVVLSWDADNTDVDLHVLDPNKEEAFYGRQLTYQGGRMSRDFTGGYGPEEFALRTAKPGIYRVSVKLYGSRAQTVTSGVTAQLSLSRGFGSKAQQDEVITVRLEATKDSTLIGEFEVR